MRLRLPKLKLRSSESNKPLSRRQDSLLASVFSKAIRNRILFTILIVVIYRLLSSIPLPGVNMTVYQQQFGNQSTSQASYLLTVFTGGQLETPSIVGLGIGVYITASIIIQLLTSIIPRLEELSKEGNRGKQIIDQYTRYLTVPLSFIYSIGYMFLITQPVNGVDSPVSNLIARNPDGNFSVMKIVFMATILTAGSLLLMWLAELITENGIGNGSSVIIMVSILSALPAFITTDFSSLNVAESFNQVLQGNTAFLRDPGMIALYLLIGGGILLVLGIVFMSESTRRLKVQYARRERGAVNTDSNLPIKLNQSGVLPIIFASALLTMPQILIPLLQRIAQPGTGFADTLNSLATSFLFNPRSAGYQAFYFIAIILLALLYSTIALKPDQIAENFQKSGAFIPGIRPGRSTENYIRTVLLRLTFVGAIFLGLIALIPLLAGSALQQITDYNFTLFSAIGGTSILIVVGVILDTLRQLLSIRATQSYDRYL